VEFVPADDQKVPTDLLGKEEARDDRERTKALNGSVDDQERFVPRLF
jgi:hypothetical protein